MEIVEFEKSYRFNVYRDGITVHATLEFGDKRERFLVKVDTGSTYCIFERGRGEALGIDIESGTPIEIGTATGSFLVFGHELRLTVMEIETVSTVYFAESEHFNRNVLGRIGWLDRLKLGIIEQEGKLLLSEYENEL